MRELSEAHLAEGTGEEFDAWFEAYRRLIHPRTLGYSGYWTALDSHDDAWVWNCVEQVTARWPLEGYEAFVVSGTLLGIIREGGLVPHDYDVDMALMLHARSRDELADEWQQLRGRLAQAGILDEYVKTGLRHYKLRLPNGFRCDLFPSWEIDGRVSIWPHTLEIDPASVLPLATRSVRGVEVRVPRVPEEVLTSTTGRDGARRTRSSSSTGPRPRAVHRLPLRHRGLLGSAPGRVAAAVVGALRRLQDRLHPNPGTGV